MSSLVGILATGFVLLLLGHLLEFRARANGPESVVETPATAGYVVGRRRRSAGMSEGTWWFVGSWALYLVVAWYLVLHRGDIVGDAEARVAQAWYVVASRDPHLAAIGFIWNPLPSLADIPLVLLRGLWPALTQKAFAGSIVSSVAMAGAVVQFRAATREMGLRKGIAIVLTACFALDPMIVYYGANGMSEAMYLFFLVGTTRYLLSWTVSGERHLLTAAAITLALGYLTRYEAFAAAAVVAGVVLVVGTNARAHTRARRERMALANSDVVIVLFPVLMAFSGWMIVSWIITGQPFQQFTSRYGNSSLISVGAGSAGVNGTNWPKIVLPLVQIMSYAPMVLAVGAVVVAVAIRRRDRRFLALGALVGPLAFSTMGYTAGLLAGWNLRFYLPVLPLYLLALALLLSPLPSMRPPTPQWLESTGGVVLALLACLPGIVTVSLAMDDPHIGPTEQAALSWLVHPPRSAAELQDEAFLPSAQYIARQIDQLGLGTASVALDTMGCGSLVVLNSANPHQFVITSDRDFEEVVADPLAFGVPYLLVPDDDQSIDAIDVAHPGIFEGGRNGDLFTDVVAQYATQGCPTYRLLRVTSDDA